MNLARRAPLARAGAAVAVLAFLGLSCSGSPSVSGWEAPATEAAADAPGPILPFARVRHVKSAPMSLTASDGTGLELVRLSAKTVVDDPLAYTELHLTFENPEDRLREGRFRIALPEGAAVSRLSMRIGEIWQEGEVLPKQTARRTYEDFLHRRQDPALLEQGAGNEVTARVFPIAPRATKEIVVAYTQRLDGAQATLVPLEGLPAVDAIDVSVTRAGESTPAQRFSRTSFAPTADLALDASLKNGGDGLRHGEVALIRARPWAEAAPDPLGSALVLLDTSASRALDFDASVALVGEVVREIARSRGADTPVSVATFDQEIELVYEGAAGAFGRSVEERIVARQALGASDLEGALRWASGYLAKRPRARVLFVTDGVATAGDDEGRAIASRAAELGKRGVDRIDVVAFGGVRDAAMLGHLVTADLPRHGIVVDATAPASEIAARLSKATRSGVSVEVEGASWWFPRELDGLQPGDEIAVFATLTGDGPPRVKVGGKALPAPRLKRTDGRLIRQAWARARIDGLLAEERRDGRSEALAERIVALSMAHRILSPHTALLVLETEGDYQRYGIDRTRLGDILAIDGGRLTTVDRVPVVAAPQPPRDPIAPTGGPNAPGLVRGDLDARGSTWGDAIGDSFGAGGLGLSGIGSGGGGRGQDSRGGKDGGLGSIGTIGQGASDGTGTGQGFGSGRGRLGRSHRATIPRVRMGATEVSGRLPPEVVQRIVRQSFGRFRLCYERALAERPDLAGSMSIRFVITKDGAAKGARVARSELAHPVMEACVASAFDGLTFPRPDGGLVTVTYPLSFSPSGGTEPRQERAFEAPPGATPDPRPDPRPVPTQPTGTFGAVMRHVANGRVDEALAAASRWRAESPGDVLALLALGEALEAGQHERFAARAYGSIIDMHPDRADLRRYAGSRLERLRSRDAHRVARDSFEKARRDRPDHPSSHRLLAFAELRLGHHEKAFDALADALSQSFRPGSFRGVDRVLREDLGLVAAAWIAQAPDVRDHVLARLERAGAKLETSPSMRVVMTWETDTNDVDLHVYDDGGGHAYYGNPTLPGAALYADVTNGFGPECFAVTGGAKPGARYELFAHYYRRGPMGYGMGKAQIIHHDGRGGLTLEERPFIATEDDAHVALGTVTPRFD